MQHGKSLTEVLSSFSEKFPLERFRKLDRQLSDINGALAEYSRLRDEIEKQREALSQSATETAENIRKEVLADLSRRSYALTSELRTALDELRVWRSGVEEAFATRNEKIETRIENGEASLADGLLKTKSSLESRFSKTDAEYAQLSQRLDKCEKLCEAVEKSLRSEFERALSASSKKLGERMDRIEGQLASSESAAKKRIATIEAGVTNDFNLVRKELNELKRSFRDILMPIAVTSIFISTFVAVAFFLM